MGNAEFLLGTVASVSTTYGVKIQLDGQDAAMSKYYKMLMTGAGGPSVGDRVVIMKHSGTYVVLGKIGVPSDDGGAGANKVSKSGDTMTGGLVMDNSNVSIKDPVITLGTRPAANHWTMQFRFLDTIGEAIAWIRAVAGANGLTGIQLYGRNIASGTGKNNYLGLYMSDAGAATVDINQPAAWRKALGLGSTSGTLPITVAQGGTGNTGVVSTTTIDDIITAGSEFTVTGAQYCAWGKIAMIFLLVSVNSETTSSAWHTVGTLQSGKRPACHVYTNELNNNEGSLLTTGDLRVWGKLASGKTLEFSAIYLLA